MVRYHAPETVFAHSEMGGSYPVVENQVESAANYLTNNTSHNFSFRSEGSTNETPHDRFSESEFVESCMRKLADQGKAQHGDHIVVAHNAFKHGYGGGEAHITYNGLDLHGVAVFADDGTTVNLNEVRHFVWHELGHIMNGDHIEGCYQEAYDAGHGEVMTDRITPLATGYVRGKDGNNDVQYTTVNLGFNSFDCGMPLPADVRNDKSDFKNHHTYEYSTEVINDIDNRID